MLNKRVFAKRIAAFSLAALFLCSTFAASTTETTQVTTGHVNWVNMNDYDPCLAGVAGLASSRVLWFNDAVLVDNYAFGNTWIYVSEHEAPDPRGKELSYVRSWEFTDPNSDTTGHVWNVTEFQYYIDGGASTYGTDADPDVEGNPLNSDADARVHARAGPYYTWVVRLLEAPTMDMFQGPEGATHGLYNFVVLVDTCKFLRGSGDPEYDAEGLHGTEEHSPHTLGDDPEGHSHEKFLADIYLGEQPDASGTYIPAPQPGYDHSARSENNGKVYDQPSLP